MHIKASWGSKGKRLQAIVSLAISPPLDAFALKYVLVEGCVYT